MANVGVVTALAKPGDTLFLDKLSHASLVDGARLSGARVRTFPHRNYERLERLLTEKRGEGEVFVLTDSLFSMDGDLADLPRLVQICTRFEATLLVDEAHATGMLGRRGRGVLELQDTEGKVPVVIGTLSKALGGQGGFVCGSRLLVDSLINSSRPFIFSTGLTPPAVVAALAGVEWIRDHPQCGLPACLKCRQAFEELTGMGFKCSPPGFEGEAPGAHILPVIVGSEERAEALGRHLQTQGILAPAIRPPTVPPGTARLRLSFMNDHTDAMIESVFQAFANFS
jgi:7-keto-8-aminopelargonate synthetase-like enzyme